VVGARQARPPAEVPASAALANRSDGAARRAARIDRHAAPFYIAAVRWRGPCAELVDALDSKIEFRKECGSIPARGTTTSFRSISCRSFSPENQIRYRDFRRMVVHGGTLRRVDLG